MRLRLGLNRQVPLESFCLDRRCNRQFGFSDVFFYGEVYGGWDRIVKVVERAFSPLLGLSIEEKQ